MLQEQVDKLFNEHRHYLFQFAEAFQNAKPPKDKEAELSQYRRALELLEDQIKCLLSHETFIRDLESIDFKLVTNEHQHN